MFRLALFALISASVIGFSSAEDNSNTKYNCKCPSSIEFKIPNLPAIVSNLLGKLVDNTGHSLALIFEPLLEGLKGANVTDQDALQLLIKVITDFEDKLSSGTIDSVDKLKDWFFDILSYIRKIPDAAGKIIHELPEQIQAELQQVVGGLPSLEGIINTISGMLQFNPCSCAAKVNGGADTETSTKGGFLSGGILFGR